MSFFNFAENKLTSFSKLQYKSSSHTFNKAVIAAYNNVKKYGYTATDDYIRVDQSQRSVFFILNPDMDLSSLKSDKKMMLLCESPIFKKKTKEVCYDLSLIFNEDTTANKRGVKFTDRPEAKIVDYKKDQRLDQLYAGWKKTKEEDPKTFLMTFNPPRYLRSYELLDHGFEVYQKLVLVRDKPYAVINFALQGSMAYEMSFLSLFKDPDLKLINDQNDCIIINCLHDMYTRGIGLVNLGTDAGIKGLKFFKHKLPSFEKVVYSQ